MKKTLLIILIGFIITVNNVFANKDNEPNSKTEQKVNISGSVVDVRTGEPLAGVSLCVEGTNIKVYTDLDGLFLVKGILPGDYNLILSLISYKNSFIENIKINSEKNIDVKLETL